jgi:hypothetical protein
MGLRANTVAGAATTGNRAVARTVTNSTAVLLGRIGYAARGAVYLIVGWLALRAAVGTGTAAADKQAALAAVAQQPGGSILLGLVAAGLFAYAGWSLVRAVFDPERLGHKPGALAARVGSAIAGVSYAGLGVAAANLALGTGTTGQSSDASTQDWTARLLGTPFGPPLVIAVGLVLLGVAAMEFLKAFTASFGDDLILEGLGAELRQWIMRVGRMGLAARGTVFALIGVFLIQASRHEDASEAVGLGGALQKLAEQPHGELWLGVVAAGLFMYGLYSFVEARYRRMKR